METSEIRLTRENDPTFTVAVVGTGFSGIATAVLLKQAGIESFVMLEKADDLGGTWRENTYPGAACDVPSHLYSFSFEPKADWTHAYSPQAEIQGYLRHCVAKHDLTRHILFGSHVTGATFHEPTGTWTIDLAGAAPIRAHSLVLGNGALHIPSYPEIEGLDSFTGEVFHSAKWNHAYDLAGKKVAVIGTGASAIQFVPEIAPEVGKLHLFQRTPPWVLPKPDYAYPEWAQQLFAWLPPTRWLHRSYLYWLHELRALGFVVDPRLMTQMAGLARRYLRSVVQDPELRAKLTPTYTMGCKRILLSNDYYPALARPNVEVVTDGIERVTARGVVTHDGIERPVDAIILATGFSATDYLAPIRLIGRRGRNLNDVIQQTREHFLGINVAGFPNLHLLMGPNTGLGHNSMIFMIEAQARYAVQAIQALESLPANAALEVRGDVQSTFTAALQERMKRTVWSSGCASWYLKEGYNATLWPGFTFEYWLRTRWFRPGNYDVRKPAEAPEIPALVPADAAVGA